MQTSVTMGCRHSPVQQSCGKDAYAALTQAASGGGCQGRQGYSGLWHASGPDAGPHDQVCV
jgi:hypothetical protein